MFRDRKKIKTIFAVFAAFMVLAMVVMALGPAFFGL